MNYPSPSKRQTIKFKTFQTGSSCLFLLPSVLWAVGSQSFAVSLALYCILWLLAVIDWATFRLPNYLTGLLVVSGLLFNFWMQRDNFGFYLQGAGAGFVVPILVNSLYQLIRGNTGLGIGDAKLLAGAGAWLGWTPLPQIFLMAGCGLLLFVISQRAQKITITTYHHIPFGPFLCLAIWLTWLRLL